jgi:hypothetical protein
MEAHWTRHFPGRTTLQALTRIVGFFERAGVNLFEDRVMVLTFSSLSALQEIVMAKDIEAIPVQFHFGPINELDKYPGHEGNQSILTRDEKATYVQVLWVDTDHYIVDYFGGCVWPNPNLN